MPPIILHHAKLGSLKCLHDTSTSLTQILGLPYATIPHRFARSILCPNLSSHPSSSTRLTNNTFDATYPGPSSIQPFGSVKSDASNIPLPTDTLPNDEAQSENCLTLSLHLPPSALDPNGKTFNQDAKVPIIVFIHGGAYFLGSGSRPYYTPTSLLTHALSTHKPVILISLTYRLGALGFMAAQTASDVAPPNNGLHDQLRALEWVKRHVAGFGGDEGNVCVLGQSAGGESITVLANSKFVAEEKLFCKAIALSGTTVTMPSLTPSQHTANFITQASALGIPTKGVDIEHIVQAVISADVNEIRKLAWVGLPCTQTELFPFDKPTMGMMRAGGPDVWRAQDSCVVAQIVGSTTYDGGISFNMMARDEARSRHGRAFVRIAVDVLGDDHGSELCDIYGVTEGQDDDDALQRVCLFESDVGFFFGALSIAEAGLVEKTYFQIFDLPNPFDGPLRKMGKFATHTFDITTLLGGYDESLLPEGYAAVIAKWRDVILDFVVDGTPPCEVYGGKEGKKGALLVDQHGVRSIEREEYMGADGGRRRRLMELADRVDAEEGWDILWVDVCRRFLMKGE
jgi:carboxylesterase type B